MNVTIMQKLPAAPTQVTRERDRITHGGSTMSAEDTTGPLPRLWAERGHTQQTGPAGYQLRISHEIEDPAWDTFLAATPGGHHVQTSLWGQVKAVLGWRTVRVAVTRGEHIVAGAQVLLRSLPLVGAIGYVHKGPLVAVDDPLLVQLVIDAMHRVARAQRVQYLVVQPPDSGAAVADHLPSGGFRPSSIAKVQTATILLDLTQDLDEILAQMKKKTRQNIRRGQRQGITVHEGGEQDLPTFYRLLVAASRRQKFPIYPEEYFSRLWRIFRPHKYIRLFLAEYAGEAVSAQLAIGFRDTLFYYRLGWSGHHGSHNPNEALEWAVIQWAKTQGYRSCDFGGINPKAARAIIQGEPLPDAMKQTFTFFKLGFGGQVTLAPNAYDYVHNPVLRWGSRTVFPKVANLSAVKKVHKRLLRGTG